jgi:hypothetical protein
VLLVIRASIAVAVLASAVGVAAQDAYVVAPNAYRKQFENDLVRVTRVHYAPHEQLAEHGHPARPTIYVYLQDGGPVLFKHEHGDSGAMAAIRPATKAGAYRIALGRNETHVVDNQSDLPSDFLQVELKTDIDPKTFSGRRFRDPSDTADRTAVEFDTPQIRIVRVRCSERKSCASVTPQPSYPTLQISLPGGDTVWRAAAASPKPLSGGEYLLVEFKGAAADGAK